MTNKKLLILVAIINIVMMFLIVHKQNKIIKHLYHLQQLQEQRNELLEQKKELTLTLHKLTQLSTIEAYSKNQLKLRPMTLKDAHTIPTKITSAPSLDHNPKMQTLTTKDAHAVIAE